MVALISINPIQVDLGQIAVVVGPNGAGKSTAMKAILKYFHCKVAAKKLNEAINDLPTSKS